MQRICVSNISLQKSRNIHVSLYLQAFSKMAIFNFTDFPKAQLHEPIASMKLKMSSDWFEGIRATKRIHGIVNLASELSQSSLRNSSWKLHLMEFAVCWRASSGPVVPEMALWLKCCELSAQP